jgi:phosphonate transport system permease protein
MPSEAASSSPLTGSRRWVVLVLLLLGLGSSLLLDLRWSELVPSTAGWQLAESFFSGLWAPAWQYEATPPAGTVPFLLKIATAAWETLRYALVGVSLAIVMGLPLGALASSLWWNAAGSQPSFWQRSLQPLVRGFSALVRSVHELLWAVLFLAALGLNPFTAVLAIALPYAGIIGKIFAELIDEAPTTLLDSYRSLGASRAQLFFLALVPRTLPDLLAYLMYRLETGLRSSAIMGFLGIPTLGNFLRLSFENAHYREVWTCLYVMLLLCITFDWWSTALRKHLVIRN